MEDISKPQLPEAGAPAPDMDVSKRDAGDAAVEEPPAKKARVEEPTEPVAQDSRDKGIAPIKAEYVQCLSSPARSTDVCQGIALKPRPNPVPRM